MAVLLSALSAFYTFFALWGADVIEARLVHVVDGDTLIVQNADIGQITVRLQGIDAPEIKGRCMQETLAGGVAMMLVGSVLPEGRTVSLRTNWEKDNYGRIIGRITVDGTDLADELVKGGAAKYWFPNRPKPRWCL